MAQPHGNNVRVSTTATTITTSIAVDSICHKFHWIKYFFFVVATNLCRIDVNRSSAFCTMEIMSTCLWFQFSPWISCVDINNGNKHDDVKNHANSTMMTSRARNVQTAHLRVGIYLCMNAARILKCSKKWYSSHECIGKEINSISSCVFQRRFASFLLSTFPFAFVHRIFSLFFLCTHSFVSTRISFMPMANKYNQLIWENWLHCSLILSLLQSFQLYRSCVYSGSVRFIFHFPLINGNKS